MEQHHPSAPRRLTENLLWLPHCVESDGRHMHTNQYLLEGEATVLVDAGPNLDWPGLRSTVEAALDGTDLDVLVCTHGLLPHTENVDNYRETWPDVTVISASGSPRITGVEGARPRIQPGPTELAGHAFEFLDPLLTDLGGSYWMYSDEERVLFTAEGFGNYHAPSACASTSAELEDGVTVEDLRAFNADKLAHVRYFDPEKFHAGFERTVEGLDIDYLAPIHGNVVEWADIDRYMSRVLESIRQVKAEAA